MAVHGSGLFRRGGAPCYYKCVQDGVRCAIDHISEDAAEAHDAQLAKAYFLIEWHPPDRRDAQRRIAATEGEANRFARRVQFYGPTVTRHVR